MRLLLEEVCEDVLTAQICCIRLIAHSHLFLCLDALWCLQWANFIWYPVKFDAEGDWQRVMALVVHN